MNVNSYTKKLEAEDAAKNVEGVTAVVEKIEIKFNNFGKKDDYIFLISKKTCRTFFGMFLN